MQSHRDEHRKLSASCWSLIRCVPRSCWTQSNVQRVCKQRRVRVRLRLGLGSTLGPGLGLVWRLGQGWVRVEDSAKPGEASARKLLPKRPAAAAQTAPCPPLT